jgi:hypothetical protein
MARQTQWAAAAGCWLVNWRQERPFKHENTTEFNNRGLAVCGVFERSGVS